MNSAILPAPLHLHARSSRAIAPDEVHALLSDFLASESSALLSGSGAVRASLARLAQGLKHDLSHPDSSSSSEFDSKKRRNPLEPNASANGNSDGNKRRKV